MSPSLIASILTSYNTQRAKGVKCINKIQLVPQCVSCVHEPEGIESQVQVNSGEGMAEGACAGCESGGARVRVGDGGMNPPLCVSPSEASRIQISGEDVPKDPQNPSVQHSSPLETKSKAQVAQVVLLEEDSSESETSRSRTLGNVEHDETRLQRNRTKNLVFYMYGLVLFGLMILAWGVSQCYRLVAQGLLRVLYSGKMWIMKDPLDTIWAYETPFSSSNIVFILRCKGTPDLDRLVDDFERKVINYRTFDALTSYNSSFNKYSPYKKLQWIVRQKLGFYCWQQDDDFNLRNHFYMEKVMDECSYVEQRIQTVSEAYLETRLDERKPQWEFRVIAPVGGSESSCSDYAIVFCVHHSYGDGMSWMQMLSQCLADESAPLSINPLIKPNKHMSAPGGDGASQQKVNGALQMCKSLWNSLSAMTLVPHVLATQFVDMLSEKHDFHGDFNLSPKSCKWLGKCISLQKLKQAQKKCSSISKESVCFTATILSAVTAAFRRSLKSVQAQVPFQVLAGIPYADLPYNSLEPVNKFTMALCPLPTRITENSLFQLIQVNRSVEKASSEKVLRATKIVTGICGSLVGPLMKLSVRQAARCSIAVSNLPGPKGQMSLCGGHQVSELVLIPPLKYRTGAIIGIVTYNDHLHISVSADTKITRKHGNFAATFLQYLEQDLLGVIHLGHGQEEDDRDE